MKPSLLAFVILLMGLAICASPVAVLPAQAAQVSFTSSPAIQAADQHSATITWSTNTSSNSRVMYGTDPNNLTQVAEGTPGTKHSVRIDNLQPGTTYYFQAEAGEAESCGVRSFITAAAGQPPITTPRVAPVVQKCTPSAEQQKLKITNGPMLEYVDSNSAAIAWSTNVKGSTRVMYATDPNNLAQLAEAPWGAGGLTHRVKLQNLQPNTTYYFKVETGQAQGLQGAEVESPKVYSFKTPPVGAPPIRNQATH